MIRWRGLSRESEDSGVLNGWGAAVAVLADTDTRGTVVALAAAAAALAFALAYFLLNLPVQLSERTLHVVSRVAEQCSYRRGTCLCAT